MFAQKYAENVHTNYGVLKFENACIKWTEDPHKKHILKIDSQ